MVTHALTLCAQVRLILWCWNCVQWYAFHNSETISTKAAVLGRVVGHEAKFASTKVGKNLRANSVFATINRKSKFGVGVNGVEAFVLQ